MKLIGLGFLFFVSSARALPGEIFLSECNRYPQYDAAAIRYLNNGPSLYGVWYYDLVFRNERTYLLVDAFERPACEKPIVRSVIQKKRFEVAENYGKPAQLGKDVQAFLRAHAIEMCP